MSFSFACPKEKDKKKKTAWVIADKKDPIAFALFVIRNSNHFIGIFVISSNGSVCCTISKIYIYCSVISIPATR